MVGLTVDSLSNDERRVIKCVLVGDAAVGKTSLIVSYTTNGYPHDYVPTAFDNYSVLVRVDNQPIRLQLCDTAGQAEFDSLRRFSYLETDVFLLCFSVMLPSSLRSITNHWLPEIVKCSPHTPIILVGTQCDLRSNIGLISDLCKNGERPISELKARMLADELQTDYFECSALTQYNLKQVFDAAILLALKGKSAAATKNGLQTETSKKSRFRSGFRRFVSFTKRLV